MIVLPPPPPLLRLRCHLLLLASSNLVRQARYLLSFFYTRQQCSLRSLAIMCQGLLDDAGGPLVNTSVQPWNQVKPNKLKLMAKELRDEVTRRHAASENVLSIPVENRKTQAMKDKSVWKLLADKWNDPLYFPVTSVKEDTHSDFLQLIALSFETVSHMQPATVKKVHKKW